MQIRQFQTAAPTDNIPILSNTRFPTVALSGAGGTYEEPIFVADAGCAINQIDVVPQAAVTGNGTNGAYVFFNWYRPVSGAAIKLGGDGALGGFNLGAAGANHNLVASLAEVVQMLGGFAWTGTIGALTGASSTGGTLAAIGTSALNDGQILNGKQVLIDPDNSAVAEYATLTAYNSGTGVCTFAAAVANNHPAGTLVVVVNTPLWMGTTAAITANSTTAAALTAKGGSSTATFIGNGSTLIYEQGSANQEILLPGQFTYSAGTVTIGAGYNAGKFAIAHASGAPVIIANTGGKAALLKGDVITMKHTQFGGTGLALPACMVAVNYQLNRR